MNGRQGEQVSAFLCEASPQNWHRTPARLFNHGCSFVRCSAVPLRRQLSSVSCLLRLASPKKPRTQCRPQPVALDRAHGLIGRRFRWKLRGVCAPSTRSVPGVVCFWVAFGATMNRGQEQGSKVAVGSGRWASSKAFPQNFWTSYDSYDFKLVEVPLEKSLTMSRRKLQNRAVITNTRVASSSSWRLVIMMW